MNFLLLHWAFELVPTQTCTSIQQLPFIVSVHQYQSRNDTSYNTTTIHNPTQIQNCTLLTNLSSQSSLNFNSHKIPLSNSLRSTASAEKMWTSIQFWQHHPTVATLVWMGIVLHVTILQQAAESFSASRQVYIYPAVPVS